jgi:F0F1-type ATP synthase epsilon subunit
VGLVTLPGAIGEYGVTAGHTPIISELKAGVVQIFENLGDSEPIEKYFISGGFAVTKENSETNVLATEIVKLDQLDPERVRAGLAEFRAAMDSAAPDSIERAKAQISVEVHEAMVSALGLTA